MTRHADDVRLVAGLVAAVTACVLLAYLPALAVGVASLGGVPPLYEGATGTIRWIVGVSDWGHPWTAYASTARERMPATAPGWYASLGGGLGALLAPLVAVAIRVDRLRGQGALLARAWWHPAQLLRLTPRQWAKPRDVRHLWLP